ncbi:MAG: T9SS type A sorting domain-containing protein [Bacteroidota bacterium]
MRQLYAVFGLLVLIGPAPVKAVTNPVTGVSVTTPVLSVTPKTGDFYGVQVGLSNTINFTIRNTGVSVLKIKKIEITGECFTLNDTNSYPFEVIADSGYAFPVGNSGKFLKFSVNFKPADLGVKTGKVFITYGLYSDMTYEIPLTGEGLSCYEATVAHKGENWAPKQDTWFKYTADKFSIVEVNSCHIHQRRIGNVSWELYLYGYSDCEGTLLCGGGEYMESCKYGPQAVILQKVMNAGETIYLFWPLAWPDSPHANEGFYFNIKATYPVDGDVCENAIPLRLPAVNHFGTTVGLNDDYNSSPCSPYINYMEGNDKVYTITLPDDGYLTGDIIGTYGSIHVIDVCPVEEFPKDHCKAFTGGPNGGKFRKKIEAGTYYVIISSWSPPQAIDYLLNLSFEGVSDVENDDLTSSLMVYPNPSHDRFTVAVSFDVPTELCLELVSLRGQVVYRNEIPAAYSIREEIDVSGFAKGIYYLRVNNGKELRIRKVVVE